MFEFKLEPEIPLLTVTRSGSWSLTTVASYEAALRVELAKLQLQAKPSGFIIDVRPCGEQLPDVAVALRSMVARLGSLHADYTAVVTAGGLAKLQAKHVAAPRTRIFTSMVLARDWIMANVGSDAATGTGTVHDEPSDAAAEGPVVHIHGPSDVDVTLTPAAALETARRISDAAVEALVGPGQ